jgi:shikimate kinase
MNRLVVVSGLPASGKSTVAKALAAGLAFTLLDKDSFLEALLERSPVTSMRTQRRTARWGSIPAKA